MKPTDLRGILQYIPRFRDRIFVISIDGAVVADENFANILTDVAVLRSLNIQVVLVHGAAEQIRRLAAEQQVTPSNTDGSGITDAATFELALIAANANTHRLLEGLATQDLRAACPNAVIAHPVGILHGIDHLLTGKVEKVDVGLLQTLLQQGVIPVISPLGFDGEGRTYRVNSDAVAAAVATAVKAIKLIFITGYNGLHAGGQLLRQVLITELERLLTASPTSLAPEYLSKARYAFEACQGGVPRVHVINGRLDEALLSEVFSNEGIGTLVYASEYQQIRRALKRDLPEIVKLIRPSIDKEELVKRTRASIERALSDYFIFEIDRNPIACVALHHYAPEHTGEIASLCVKPSHENQGIGRKFLQYLEDAARQMGIRRLIALSTQAFTYFQQKGGFREGRIDDLPTSRRARYVQSGRNSKILVKDLA